MPLLARVSPASTSIQSVTNLMIFLGANGHVATTFFFYTDGPLKSYMREHRGRYLVAPLALVLVTGLLCLLFIHPGAPNLISLRSAGTMPA